MSAPKCTDRAPAESLVPMRLRPGTGTAHPAHCTIRHCKLHDARRVDTDAAGCLAGCAVRSLRGRLRLLTAGLTIAFGVAAVLVVARLRVLEGSVTNVLSRNYRSIEAAEGMDRAISSLPLAV